MKAAFSFSVAIATSVALVGVLVYLIRHWGSYPDAVAFAVLLLNFAAPLLDHYTQPRAYGHDSGRSA